MDNNVTKGITRMTSFSNPELNMYRISCDCGSNDHDINFWVEYDEDLPGTFEFVHDVTARATVYDSIEYEMHDETWLPDFLFTIVYGTKYRLLSFYKRIKMCAEILFKGKIYMNCSTIMDEEQLDAYMEVLVAMREHSKNHTRVR